jgi:hypothetical protein
MKYPYLKKTYHARIPFSPQVRILSQSSVTRARDITQNPVEENVAVLRAENLLFTREIFFQTPKRSIKLTNFRRKGKKPDKRRKELALMVCDTDAGAVEPVDLVGQCGAPFSVCVVGDDKA